MALTVANKLEVITKTWNLEATSVVPYVIEIGEPHFATKSFYDDDQAELAWNEAYIRDRSEIDDFGVPNIKTNIGIGVMAAAFGCETIVNNESDPWSKPLITEDNISDVFDLRKPDPASNPIYLKSIERLKYIQSSTSHHIRLVNIPSPLVTASLIWDYTSFIQATLIHPKEVHALLDVITEATIEFVNLQLGVITNPVSMGHEIWHIPRNVGIRISDDTAALLSPQLYREFGVTYNARMSEAFGGIVIHSCGELKHVLPVMMETPGVRGIDLTVPQNEDWGVIKKSVLGRAALNLRYFYWDHLVQNVDSVAYTKKLIDEFGTQGIFLQTSAPTQEEAVQLGEAIGQILT